MMNCSSMRVFGCLASVATHLQALTPLQLRNERSGGLQFPDDLVAGGEVEHRRDAPGGADVLRLLDG